MTLTVGFCVQVDGGDCLDEQELALPAASSHVFELRHLDGAITIRSGMEVAIEDELPPLVQNLCFRALPALLAGEAVSLRYFSMPGEFRLHPTGDVVRISGDLIEEVSLNRRELIPALYECGVRFIGALRHLGGEDPRTAGVVQNLEADAEATRRALTIAGIDVSSR